MHASPIIPGQAARVPARLGEKTASRLARGQHRTLSDDIFDALLSFQFVPPFSKRSKCLKFVANEMTTRLEKFLLEVSTDKRRVTATVVAPTPPNSGATGENTFDVSYVIAQESERYMPWADTILRVTHHATARLLERGGRADLQQALVDELKPAARSLRALAEAYRDETSEHVDSILLPTATGHFVVLPPRDAVTWVSDTAAVKEVRGRVEAARAAGCVVRESSPEAPATAERT